MLPVLETVLPNSRRWRPGADSPRRRGASDAPGSSWRIVINMMLYDVAVGNP
jgi:hypothetical protein